MCTVTWLRRPDGYDLLFNRDERRTRPPAEPPSVHDMNGIKAIFPVDPQAGGSWLGVNQYGVTLGIMNYYTAEASHPPGVGLSRGQLLLSLLGATSAADAMERAQQQALEHYPPFILLALDVESPVVSCTWDGRKASRAVLARPNILTTSSFDEGRVVLTRLETFREWEGSSGERALEDLLSFHRSQHPEPGAYAVCMKREEACTHSLSHVQVTASSVSFRYADGPPCDTPLGPPIEIEHPAHMR